MYLAVRRHSRAPTQAWDDVGLRKHTFRSPKDARHVPTPPPPGKDASGSVPPLGPLVVHASRGCGGSDLFDAKRKRSEGTCTRTRVCGLTLPRPHPSETGGTGVTEVALRPQGPTARV